jgi:hypothetical protein
MIDRRKHRRIVTLRNFGWLTVAMLIAFIGLSFDRRVNSEGFGRIMEKQIAPNDDVRARPQVVTEAPPVPDQTAADPLLLAPAAREQAYLSTEPVQRAPIAAAQIAPVDTSANGGSVSIVGDSGGVVIIRNGESANRPLLAGGIFKQP